MILVVATPFEMSQESRIVFGKMFNARRHSSTVWGEITKKRSMENKIEFRTSASLFIKVNQTGR